MFLMKFYAFNVIKDILPDMLKFTITILQFTALFSFHKQMGVCVSFSNKESEIDVTRSLNVTYALRSF